MSFDAKEPTISLRRRGFGAAAVQFGGELAAAMGYWIGVLAVLGARRLGRPEPGRNRVRGIRSGASPGDRFVQIFFVLFSGLAVWFSAAEGYLDARHLAPLVVAAMGAAGVGALELGRWLSKQVPPSGTGGPSALADGSRGRRAGRRWQPAVVVAAAALGCLPQASARLHPSRLGHRQAGVLLAGRPDRRASVLDTRGWTGLYSGRKTYPFRSGRAALADRELAYLVVESRELGYDSRRSRTLRWLVESAAEPLGAFPDRATRRPGQERVVVYRWRADRFRDRSGRVAGVAGGVGHGRGLRARMIHQRVPRLDASQAVSAGCVHHGFYEAVAHRFHIPGS